MLKFIGMSVLLAAAFTLGYYAGQHPVGDMRETVTELSRNVFDRTLGMERDLRQRHALLEAKAHLVQAKADLLDRNYGNAAKALAETAERVEAAVETAPDSRRGRLKTLVKRIQETQADVAQGKRIGRDRLDEIQVELDGLL